MKLTQQQIAAVLEAVAEILEIKGANPFKVRAYKNAARVVDALADDLEQLISKGTLINIKGIGKNLAAHIVELAQTGKLKEYEELEKSIPAGLLEITKIQGVGAKKVAVLWHQLKVTSVEKLEKVCKAGKVASLTGFGEKSQEKILQGIANLKQFSGRTLYPLAYEVAKEILTELASCPALIRLELAGSLRRCKETIKDIDIVASSNKPNKLMDYFVELPQVEQVVNKGTTKSSVMLSSGVGVDLRVVNDEEFPFALQHFTGSKEHNVALRSLAKKNNLKINEYGLFKGKQEKFIPCKDEAELYANLGLEFVEPELREDMGEIRSSQTKVLPGLLAQKDLVGLVHNHSTYSDGKNTIKEMALAAKKLGYKYISINDHSQTAAGFIGGLLPDQIKQQHDEIDQLNEEIAGFRIIKGIEVEIHPDGSLDYTDKIMESFELVVAEVQPKVAMSEAQMTKRICLALQNPFVDILAHPTGRLLLRRAAYSVDMHAVIDCAAENGVAIEINANPNRLDVDWRLGPYMKAAGVKTVIAPDAHRVDQLDNAKYGVNIARKAWFEKNDVLNCLSATALLKHVEKMRRQRR